MLRSPKDPRWQEPSNYSKGVIVVDNDTVWEHDEARGSLGKRSRDTTPMRLAESTTPMRLAEPGIGLSTPAESRESERSQEVYRTMEDLLDFWVLVVNLTLASTIDWNTSLVSLVSVTGLNIHLLPTRYSSKEYSRRLYISSYLHRIQVSVTDVNKSSIVNIYSSHLLFLITL